MSHQKSPPFVTRIEAIMQHTGRYCANGKGRLARDTGLTKMAVARLVDAAYPPSYRTVHLVREALERALGRRLDTRDLVSYEGSFPESTCDFCGCRGCLPDGAILANGTVHPAYEGVMPGRWDGLPNPKSRRRFPVSGQLTLPVPGEAE